MAHLQAAVEPRVSFTQALAAQNFLRAASDFERWLLEAPTDPWIARALSQMAQATPEPITTYFDVRSGRDTAVVAFALAMAQEGRSDQALVVLAQVAALRPAWPVLHLIASWPLPAREPWLLALDALTSTQDPRPWHLAERTLIRRWMDHHPSDPDAARFMAIACHRQAEPEAAVSWADRSIQLGGGLESHLVLADIHRDLHHYAEAQSAWQRAIDLDPDDVRARLAWADCVLHDQDQPEQARLRYAQILTRHPGQTAAQAGLRFLDWQRQPTWTRWAALRDWARVQDHPRAKWALAQATAWVGWLPPYTAVPWTGAADSTPAPLFERRTDQRVPALSPPSPETARVVEVLAEQPFHGGLWMGLAKRGSRRLGPTAVDEVLATAAHATDRMDHPSAWAIWHAAAFLLVGYGDSAKHAVERMLAMPMDGCAVAMLAALTLQAEQEPHRQQRVLTRLLAILDAQPHPQSSAAQVAWSGLLRLDPHDALRLHAKALDALDSPS